jgi:pSer/pThr/pTyr-binding forkhead associated (FHA) protein
VATPTAAGEDLASVPLPAACEVSLEVTGGPDRGSAFRVERSRILIGRGEVDVALADRKISRRHASLEVYGASCVLLKDLGSTNGTFVNDRRVPSAELQDGDLIRVGETTVQVSICQTPAALHRRA